VRRRASLARVILRNWPLVALLLLAVAALTVLLVRRRDVAVSAPFGPGSGVQGGERFRRSGRWTGGYRRDEVDRFFARIDGGQVTAELIEDVRFGAARGSDGYDEREVDEALDRAAARLRVV
jgi:DivIVA domain-containing protein